jgi:hypothetical protein
VRAVAIAAATFDAFAWPGRGETTSRGRAEPAQVSVKRTPANED